MEDYFLQNRNKKGGQTHLVVAENVIRTVALGEGQAKAILTQVGQVLREKDIPAIQTLQLMFDEKMLDFRQKVVKDLKKTLKDKGIGSTT